MSVLLAIDPGPVESAWVLFDTDTRAPVEFGKEPNEFMITRVRWRSFPVTVDLCVIEMIASYGMPVGAEVFQTCVVIGRIWEAWRTRQLTGRQPLLLTRVQVKTHLCHSARATDANIRQALIDLYGGKDKAIGRKRSPGPLYGVKGDVWAALAVAITATETHPRTVGKAA